MRLGELLVASQLIRADQLDRALRAQVLWGARLGTNLVELGLLDLDTLTRALGRQHGLPAALARHFDAADPAVQAQLTVEQARQWAVVPLLRIGEGEIAVACMDPLDVEVRAELAGALGVAPVHVVVSIAAEQRVRYQLERVYGIARSARYLRTPGSATMQVPDLDDSEIPIDSDVEIDIPIDVDEGPSAPPPEPHAVAEELAALIEEAVGKAGPAPARDEPSGRDRRHYVKTLADDAAPPATSAAPGTLGRIAIKKLPTTRSIPKIADAADPARKGTLADATRAIRRGHDRDRVVELVVEALDKFAPGCHAALVMVVRGEVAIGWKHFCRSGSAPPELAVPLAKPGLVPTAVARNESVRRGAHELDEIDRALLRALGGEGDLAVVPVPIGSQVLCLVAAAMRSGAALDDVEQVAIAASTAFAKLVRDASR